MARVHADFDGLADALDRVLHRGAVLRGDLVVAVADIDLLYLDLRIFLSSVDTALAAGALAARPLADVHPAPLYDAAGPDAAEPGRAE
jgi:hypothetical protein